MGGQLSGAGPALAFVLKGRDDGVTVVEQGGTLATYDVEGKRTGELALPKGALGAAPFEDGWLLRVEGATHLVPFSPSKREQKRGKSAAFADGGSDVTAFAVTAAGIAVARAGSLDLWAHAGKLRWSVPSGPWVVAVIVPSVIVGLAEDGALVFAAMRDGATLGTLRLASTEPVDEWRLVVIDAGRLVMALGEWLVWVDVATRKTIRRVRAREKVTALAADGEWVVCGLEGGGVQAFRAESGDACASFDAHEGGVRLVAVGRSAVFTAGASGPVRAWPRSALDTEKKAGGPVTALASRGELVAVGDRAGTVKLLRGGVEIASRPVGEAILSVHVGRSDALVAATSRVVLTMTRPWTTPRPLALRSAASAFSADEDYAFAGTESGSVDVYDLAESTHVTTYALSDGDVTALARLPGKLLVVGTGALDGRVFVVDVTEAKVLHRLEPHDEAFGVTCLASDPRGRIVASGADDGSIALIDPAKGRVLARLRVRETPTSLAFDEAGRRLAVVFADGTAGLVSLRPGGAAIEEIALTGAARVAWGESAVFGFADGRVERMAGEKRPAVNQRSAV
ncbi:MAG: hypothetical protein KF819_29555 [Labilithrix sp.]|nr:hypothetical protein [Labilithrix sp.]